MIVKELVFIFSGSEFDNGSFYRGNIYGMF